MTRLSQRIGKNKLVKNLQIENIDEDLMNSLWNIIQFFIFNKFHSMDFNKNIDSDFFFNLLWHKVFKLPIDTIPDYSSSAIKYIRNKFFNEYEWYEIYDLIEFLSKLEIKNFNNIVFIEALNNILENKFSGYRFVNGMIVPISNKIEINEIEKAISPVNYYTSLNGANIHLTNALNKLSDKRNPDFRNSIKESISAIETTCRIITGEKTLGKALGKLEKKGLKIDSQLKEGFNKIYAYTNNKESGIRHAIIKKHKNPDFNDAKYMIVTSSAFVNYLVEKCRTEEIEFNPI